MDLRALRYFEAVYEKRSISAAARACYVAQPSISAAIQQLESTLETQLFVRHAKGVLPTEAGERLYPLARKLTGEARAIRALFVDKPVAEPFRLGLMRSPGVERLSLWLKELTSRQPQLELTLVNAEEPCDARIIDAGDLADGELFQPLWLDRYQLALPVGHPLSLRERVSIADLAELPFINREPCNALARLREAMQRRGVRFLPRANIRTLEYALGLVAAGVGAALVPDWESTRARSDLQLRAFEDIELERQVGLAYAGGPTGSPLLPTLIELCREPL